MSLRILTCLSDGAIHSIEELAERFALSSIEIDRHIEILLSLDIELISVEINHQGKESRGYQWSEPLMLLNQNILNEALGTAVEVIPMIDSTNQYLLNQVEAMSNMISSKEPITLPRLLQSGTVCVAEYQSQGRGRRGKKWLSPFASNLYLSMYWRFENNISAIMGLSLVIGIVTVEALEKLGFVGIKLKWPNDLYYQDQKIAGILVEMSGQSHGAIDIVIGIGINVTMNRTQVQLDQPWSCLKEVVNNSTLEGGSLDRNQLTITIVKAWRDALRQYECYGMESFMPRWSRLDNFMGKRVQLMLERNGKHEIEVEGVVRGIDHQGALLIENEHGQQQRYICGELSLRNKF